MFDVSWADLGHAETVGQRKQRKEQQQSSSRNGLELSTREGSMRSSRSGESRASQFKPSFLNFFGPSYRKTALRRGDVHTPSERALSSTVHTTKVETSKIARPLSSYTIDETTTQVVPSKSLTGIARMDFVGSTYQSDLETSPSEGNFVTLRRF